MTGDVLDPQLTILDFFFLGAVGDMVSFSGWCSGLCVRVCFECLLSTFHLRLLKHRLKHNLFQLLIEQLRDRLFHAQGENGGDQQPPPFPYTRVNVGVIKHTSPAAKGGVAPEGAAHKKGPNHPEKVGLKLRCSLLGEREVGLLGRIRHMK